MLTKYQTHIIKSGKSIINKIGCIKLGDYLASRIFLILTIY